MGKRPVLFAGLVAAAVLTLSGCGNSSGSARGLDAAALLAGDYEAEFIFAAAGLAVDSTAPVTRENGGIYFPVKSDKYSELDDITTLLESVYTDDTAADVLATQDMAGLPLYLEIDGKLYRSGKPVVNPPLTEADAAEAKVGPAAKNQQGKRTVTITLPEHGSDGSEAVTELVAVEQKSGEWRLAATRRSSRRTVTKEGLGSQAVQGDLAQTAQDFLTALTSANTVMLEQLAADEGSYEQEYLYNGFSYDYLAESGVVSAELTETVEESEGYGEYLVELEVSGGNNTFPEGKHSYRIIVSLRESGLTITCFRPAELEPYIELPWDQRSDMALNQVYDLMLQQGAVQFTSPGDLPNQALTEYVLAQLSKTGSSEAFTQEEIEALALRLFGIEGFEPDRSFYSEEAGGYISYGRGGVPLNTRLEKLKEGDGLVTVEARHYGDPLQLRPTGRIIYTLQNNWNGTLQFISGIATQL